MADQQITCAGCGRCCTWTTGAQQYYRERRLQRPNRCPACHTNSGSPTTVAPSCPTAAPDRARPRPTSIRKRIAGGSGLRVPEAVLLGLALAGGSLGALLGMALCRHKTGREQAAFRMRLGWIVALQLALRIAWLALRPIR